MNCDDVRRIAAAWENGDVLNEAETAEAFDHAASCGACRAALPVFLALAPRDAASRPRHEPSREARALADAVMAGIGSGKLRGARSGAIRFPPRRFGVAATAALVACALFVVGLAVRNAGTVEVRFVLDAPNARTVFLAGDFSSWDPKGLELRKTPDGVWERTIRLRRGQAYSYNFIIDGSTWVVDPAAPERVDDGFGGESALIRL
jgi:hypothetical protein